jgi:hypothetical protein
VQWGDALDRLFVDAEDAEALAFAHREISADRCTPGQRCAYELAVERVDVLTALERGPSDIRAALARSPRHDVVPQPGEWTARQVVGHLADNEAVNAVRMRAVLTEDEPELYGYDSDDWTPFYALEPLDATLERWEFARKNTMALLWSLDDDQWSRRGVISYRGPESMRVLVAVLAGHDRDHVQQIEKTLDAAERLGSEADVVR